MNVTDLQKRIGTPADGIWGPASRAAFLAAFTNREANAVTDDDIAEIAARIGCTVKQVKAVAKVESGGSAFDYHGKPKMLFERHYFHRLTQGRYSPQAYSHEVPGDYNTDSWGKLTYALGKDPDAALSSCSWGRFQVMGSHWKALGYISPWAMAHSAVLSEGDHYEMLVRYVMAFGLVKAMQQLSTDPDTCRAFAKSYNGPGFEKFKYHEKLAAAMKG